jgi:hypothetical protein
LSCVLLGAQMPDVEPSADISEGVGQVARTVVGHDALDPYTALLEVGGRRFEACSGGISALIGRHVGERQARVVVDRDVFPLPAGGNNLLRTQIYCDVT